MSLHVIYANQTSGKSYWHRCDSPVYSTARAGTGNRFCSTSGANGFVENTLSAGSYFATYIAIGFDTSAVPSGTVVQSDLSVQQLSNSNSTDILRARVQSFDDWVGFATTPWVVPDGSAPLFASVTLPGTVTSTMWQKLTGNVANFTRSTDFELVLALSSTEAGTVPAALNQANFTLPGETGTASDPHLVVQVNDGVRYVGAGAAVNNAAAATYPVPAGIQNNDILILTVETANDPSGAALTFTAGTGWSLLGTAGVGTVGGTASTRIYVYWKRTTGTETNPTIADPGNHQIGRIHAFRGCVTSGNPWDAIGSSTTGTTTSVTIPGLTTSVAACMIVDVMASGADVTSVQALFTPPAETVGFEEVADNFANVQNGGGVAMAIAYKETAGSVGSTSATLATANSFAAFKFALKPQVSTPTVVYRGIRSRAQFYRGTRTDPQLYRGAQQLFP